MTHEPSDVEKCLSRHPQKSLLGKICIVIAYVILCLWLVAIAIAENVGKLAIFLRPSGNQTDYLIIALKNKTT